MSEEIKTQEEAKVIPPEWTPVRVASLIALWEEGLPTSEIGRRLNVTKNSVVGKVHRLGLTKRESPIQHKKVKKETIATVVRLESLNAGMCSWPDGEPGAEDFRFCGELIVEGKPYCLHHCERAYVKPSKERRNSAAA
jgi:GcrA cell cycle regulator